MDWQHRLRRRDDLHSTQSILLPVSAREHDDLHHSHQRRAATATAATAGHQHRLVVRTGADRHRSRCALQEEG